MTRAGARAPRDRDPAGDAGSHRGSGPIQANSPGHLKPTPTGTKGYRSRETHYCADVAKRISNTRTWGRLPPLPRHCTICCWRPVDVAKPPRRSLRSKPIQAASLRPLRNRRASITVALNALAMTGPTPGIVSSRRATSFSRAAIRTCRSSVLISWRVRQSAAPATTAPLRPPPAALLLPGQPRSACRARHVRTAR